MDYRVHAAALDAFREQLALTNIADPQIRALRDQHIADADQEPGAALLGSFVDRLVRHASSDGAELALLERAASLWADGLELYDSLAEFRSQLETALADPSDAAAVQGLNTASAALRPLVLKVLDQQDDIDALRRDVAVLPHLPPHPRQEDRQLSDWTWGDVFAARRTEAFAREVRRQASDSQTSAFAFGVLSSYGANAVGSAYVGQVVGGPRRGHRVRDRLARNVLGSWVAGNDPSTPSLTTMANRLAESFPGSLPAGIGDLLRSSLGATYDPNLVPPLPDLEAGYQRLVRHLELLGSFAFPDGPVAPKEPFLTRLFGDPANAYTPSIPERTALVEAGQAPGPAGPGSVVPLGMGTDDSPDHSEPPSSTEVKCGPFWEAIGSAFLFLIGGWFACVIRWADNDRCPLWDNITQKWEEAFPDGASGSVEITTGPLTSEGVASIALSDQITQLIGDLYSLQSTMWEGFHKAHDFLALFGLLYPDGLLERWRYGQYTSIPPNGQAGWPRLPETGDRFDKYPLTGIELPGSALFAFGPGTTPAAVLARVPQAGTVSAADVSAAVWDQMANGVQDSTNLDLDADRGWRHACWTARGSITDQPIDVAVLQFDET